MQTLIARTALKSQPTITPATGCFSAAVAGAFVLSLLVLLGMVPAARAQSSSQAANQTAYQSVRGFLDQKDTASSVVTFVHFGATYHRHQFLRVTSVQDGNGQVVPGEMAVVYRYFWEDDGITDVAFFYDSRGTIVGSSIDWTNAVLNRPFAFANVSIRALGHMVIESDDKMSNEDRKFALDLVDRSDAHGLMNLWMRLR